MRRKMRLIYADMTHVPILIAHKLEKRGAQKVDIALYKDPIVWMRTFSRPVAVT